MRSFHSKKSRCDCAAAKKTVRRSLAALQLRRPPSAGRGVPALSLCTNEVVRGGVNEPGGHRQPKGWGKRVVQGGLCTLQSTTTLQQVMRGNGARRRAVAQKNCLEAVFSSLSRGNHRGEDKQQH